MAVKSGNFLGLKSEQERAREAGEAGTRIPLEIRLSQKGCYQTITLSRRGLRPSKISHEFLRPLTTVTQSISARWQPF
jgi:hypothetical protein